jgi:CMP-N-acetylneuraminic acid synthetase
MNVLGIILARAGSIGLKSKHLLNLMGRPVIMYTFDHARGSRLMDRVVVTTDCAEIRRLAVVGGFEVIERPPELATADASVQDVMLHAMHTAEARTPGYRADAVVVLYGNVAIRPANVIDRAIKLLLDTGADSVRSFTPVGKWHPMWMAGINGDVVENFQSAGIHRRQDLPQLFLHEGAVVAVSRSSMLRGEVTPDNKHAFFGEDRRAVKIAPDEAVEIDHLRDLYWAEAVLRERQDQIKVA